MKFLAGCGKSPRPSGTSNSVSQISQYLGQLVMASRLPSLGDRTMLRTALLIVLVMAGSPVGSLVCELWCNSPAGEDHHRAVGCHDASQSGSTGQQIAPYVAGCHDAAAIAPFVAEVRQAESAPVGTVTAALFDTSSIVPDNDETAAGWCVFDVQPPRPPSARAVLRV